MTGALLVAGGYLLGSIPFSFLVARLFGVEDIRAVGSGNVGATNVMRSAGRPAGLLAFALDAAKGGCATLVAGWWCPGPTVPSCAAVAAILGHMYPVWLRFRGGKGVATGVGCFLPIALYPSLLSLVVFPVSLLATGYVAIASLSGAFALAIAAVLLEPPPVGAAALVCATLILWRHRGNLARIRAGTEPRKGAHP